MEGLELVEVPNFDMWIECLKAGKMGVQSGNANNAYFYEDGTIVRKLTLSNPVHYESVDEARLYLAHDKFRKFYVLNYTRGQND